MMKLAYQFSAVVAVLGLFSSACHKSVAATPEAPRIGHHVPSFALKDFRGKVHSLEKLSHHQAVVVAFLGVECPLVKLYAPRLEELAKRFGVQGVAFLTIDANCQDSLAEMEHFARTHSLTIPFLKDVGNLVADQFQAERTPEVFVLDRQHVVRYRGRIDDQYGFQAGVGYQRPAATQQDLANALEDLLAGREIRLATTHAPGCLIGRAQVTQEDSPVTYASQVSRIFQNRCESCHRDGEIGPFAMSSYDEVVGWAPMIGEVVREGRMPPWHASPKHGQFANDSRLTDLERQQILTWVEHGAPLGDASELPAPRTYTVGWQIPQPDQIVPMSDTSFIVPASGEVEYQYFLADPKFTEDKWVQACECRPGNRGVVHHIIVFIVPPGEEPKRMAEGTATRHLLAGTAPGNPPTVYPAGMAKLLKAGSRLLFQMHYTSNGREQEDRSSIGLIFADPASVTREVRTDLAINPFFEVPAGADNFPVESFKKFRQDTLLLGLMPHMHLRGKAFRYTLEYPDGREEILLDIPQYDFNWQNSYQLAEPKLVPRGSRLHCVAHFDNSAENLANPDPTKPVRWGEQTWEEMMIGWFERAPAVQREPVADVVAEEDADDGAEPK